MNETQLRRQAKNFCNFVYRHQEEKEGDTAGDGDRTRGRTLSRTGSARVREHHLPIDMSTQVHPEQSTYESWHVTSPQDNRGEGGKKSHAKRTKRRRKRSSRNTPQKKKTKKPKRKTKVNKRRKRTRTRRR